MARKIYNIVQTAVLVVAVGTVLLLGMLTICFDMDPCVVVSGSMEPAIETGSLCLIDCQDRDIDKGDIIAFRQGDMTVTHRVVDVMDTGYLTKGDANEVSDSWVVDPSDAFGTCVCSVPKLGYAVMFMKSAAGLVLILTALIAFAVAGQLLKEEERA